MLPEQPVPGGHSEGTVRGRSLASWTRVGCHSPDQLLPRVQDVQQLVGVDLLRGREENDLQAFNRQQLKADAFLCIQGRVEGETRRSPHTSDTCAPGTRGKTASVGHKPAAGEEEQLSERRRAFEQTGSEATYLVYYILKEHREGQGRVFEFIQTTVDKSFILTTEGRMSASVQKHLRRVDPRQRLSSPDPGPGKTPECCAFSKVALACVLTALLSEEARA